VFYAGLGFRCFHYRLQLDTKRIGLGLSGEKQNREKTLLSKYLQKGHPDFVQFLLHLIVVLWTIKFSRYVSSVEFEA
jgi:hypothetical protein